MSERLYRDSNNRRRQDDSAFKDSDPIGKSRDNFKPHYSNADSLLSMEELDAQDDLIFQRYSSDRDSQSDGSLEPVVPIVETSTLLEKAEEMGLDSEILGNSVQDLSNELSDLSNPSSESTAWWQSLLTHVPYLGGLVEPDSGRMLLNLGDDGYALLRGDLQSMRDYMEIMSQYSQNTALFWQFPLLFGIEPTVAREAEDIMIGSRSSDLSDFIDAARNGSVDINGLETEAVPLLRWMALQAGEQSTDIEENANATESDLVFAAAISDRTIFVDPMSDSTADRLVDSIREIYSLVETAPVAEQRNVEEMLRDKLLDILSEDNRWGITDLDLDRMVDNIQDLEQELQQQIELLLTEQTRAEATTEGSEN